MKKNIEMILDVDKAKKILIPCGFDIKDNTDEEIFLKVLSIVETYGVKCNIINDELKETINNNAYLNNCNCPVCNKKISRGYEEKVFFCSQCGTHLHQRAFTKEEIERATFDNEMDSYED